MARVTNVQYTRPESGCLQPQADRVRSRPEPEMGTRRLISGTKSKRLLGARGIEDFGRQSRSDPMETVRPGYESLGLTGSQFATD